MLLFLMDKCFILFIYINILFPKISIYSLPLNKIIFLILVLITFLYSLSEFHKFSIKVYCYLFISFFLIMLLALISLFLGNELSSITEFVLSVFIILILPVLIFLSDKYNIKKYLEHIFIASTILSLYVTLLYLFFSQFPSWNPLALAVNKNTLTATQITYHNISGPQVIVVMSGWLPVATVIAYYRLVNKFSILRSLCLLLILSALIIHKMAGLWVSVFTGVFLFTFLCKKINISTKLTIGIITIIALLNASMLPEDIVSQKKASILQKSAQSIQAFDIFSQSPFVGRGLGYIYNTNDIPALSLNKNAYLESSYPMILSSTGLIGAAAYTFILFYYIARYVALRQKSMFITVLFVCYVTVLVSAIGNPYLWGGGLGLFIMSMLGASIEDMRSKHHLCVSV